MSSIITVASQKGGVGKTTTALNLGFSLSRLGARVLFVDGDPQAGMSIAANLKKKTTAGIMDVLKGAALPEQVIMPTRDPTMAMLGVGLLEPSDALLLEREAYTGNLGGTIYTVSQGFDYTIIDAPAGMGSIVNALLAISHSVLIPINCRPLSIRSLPSFLELTKGLAKSTNPNLQVDGVVVTMLDGESSVEMKLYHQLTNILSKQALFETTIPFDHKFNQASLEALPIALLPGASHLARCYMNLAMELRDRKWQVDTANKCDEPILGLF